MKKDESFDNDKFSDLKRKVDNFKIELSDDEKCKEFSKKICEYIKENR